MHLNVEGSRCISILLSSVFIDGMIIAVRFACVENIIFSYFEPCDSRCYEFYVCI